MAASARRRWKWAILSAALIAAGGAAGAWAGFAGEETSPVAVLAADLPAGHVISSADVTATEMGEADGLQLLDPQTAEGMVLTRPVAEGSPLVAGSVSETALWPEEGSALVAVPVSALPQEVEAGATVDLVAADVAEEETADDAEEPAQQPPEAVTAVVHRVVTDADDGFGDSHQEVEVVVPRTQTAQLARAVSGGQVQAAVINPNEENQNGNGQESE